MYKRKLIDTIGKAPDEAAIIDEAYTELEKRSLTHRIAGLEHQIDVNIDSQSPSAKSQPGCQNGHRSV